MLEHIVNSSTMDYLSRGMAAANLRQEVISNNIANVNTPRFKKSDVVFESLLAKELGYGENDNKLKMVRTNDRHLPQPVGGKAAPVVEMQDTTSMRVDKNNVDIDKEMANLAKNQIYFNAMAKEMGGYIQKIKTTITSK
ncbi:MAG: flagellar basal body rod protein FlgB [Anaerovibrio sp.]|uniref:flagellar basal body rod protein FlgB n=1 Tax=Anaerovibrio sp. TaxID=1872532 RepID=UPI0025D5AA0F|nr:flagellar basal body rod protein FlgB [Anaerovibrio sp.]MCR5175897.1 flagellar basal body rod protein FlgB [Anaerovibrio sp.]